MAVKNELEEKLKQLVLDSVKQLVDDKVPKGVPAAVTDMAFKELEELLQEVQIFK
jgi:flagellar biosynthesis/type III secretory pathway protein FliH